MPRTATVRPPGISFEARTPPVIDALPRLDVAAFVGFAARGPINVPVAIEDPARFHELFGEDLPLVWDLVRGDWTYAELAPAVRSFFRNGGRRCWVVRVADRTTAVVNRFVIPGLLTTVAEAPPTAAVAVARCAGQWSDALAVNATVNARAVLARVASPPDGRVHIPGAKPGDLVRLEFAPEGVIAFVAVVAPDLVAIAKNARAPSLEPLAAGTWFRRATPAVAASPPEAAELPNEPATVRHLIGAGVADGLDVDPEIRVDAWHWTDEQLVLELTEDDARGVHAGSWLRAEVGAGEARRFLFVRVDGVEQAAGSPPDERVHLVSANAWWLLDSVDAAEEMGGRVPRAAMVEMELWVREGDRGVHRLAGLGFTEAHDRFWGAAADDDSLFAVDPSGVRVTSPHPMRAVVDHPRFPLAAPPLNGGAPPRLLPLDMLALPYDEYYQPPLVPAEPNVAREGLPAYEASLFLDEALADAPVPTLLAEAFQVRYMLRTSTGVGRTLTGVHALLPIEEVALIAAPDAVQRPWGEHRARLSSLGAPTLTRVLESAEGVHLEWSGVTAEAEDDTPVSYETQVSTDPRFATAGSRWVLADVSSEGEEGREMLDYADDIADRQPRSRQGKCGPGPCPSLYYYRVRARDRRGNAGPWSNTRAASFPPALFDPVTTPRLAAPSLLEPARAPRRVVLEWTPPAGAPDGATVRYTLESARDPAFDSATVAYRGAATRFELWRAAEGVLYYRVSADVDKRSTPWSETRAVGETSSTSLAALEPGEYTPDVLRSVHTALLRLCAARGDMHAVLALPLHFREQDAAAYVADLAAGFGEDESALRTLSFGGVFHPWPVVRETTGDAARSVWPIAPDGSVCGLVAARTLRHGAWYSLINRLVAGALSLEPRLSGADAVLLDARINPISQDTRGFIVVSERTLSPLPELALLHVRRLLILLRRLALREGTALAFQSNDDVLRRDAERRFDRVLGDLFVRGAFAGVTADQGYRVVANATVNPRGSVDQGRLIIELRVAPAQPMAFITVRLVQLGGELLAEEV